MEARNIFIAKRAFPEADAIQATLQQKGVFPDDARKLWYVNPRSQRGVLPPRTSLTMPEEVTKRITQVRQNVTETN